MSKGHQPRDEATAGQWAFNEAALRAEVHFWRELIENSSPAQPHESVERMRQALALAESKLRSMDGAHPGLADGNEPGARGGFRVAGWDD